MKTKCPDRERQGGAGGEPAEETLRNQDTEKVGRVAANANAKQGRCFTAFFRIALHSARSHRPPVSRLKHSWRPLWAPAEAYIPQEAPKALTSVEGRWERDGIHQKKAMNTKSQNTKSKTGLRVRSSIHQSEQTTDSAAPAGASDSSTHSTSQPSTSSERPKLPPINFARRRANRALSTESVLGLLRKEAPSFFAVAEVVGKWVWVQFTDKQPREVTSVLAELGFHWNNKRQVWQHPCGAMTQGTDSDPRQKYPTYFPADVKPA